MSTLDEAAEILNDPERMLPADVQGVFLRLHAEYSQLLAGAKTEYGVRVGGADGTVCGWQSAEHAKKAIENRMRLFREWHEGSGYDRDDYADPGVMVQRVKAKTAWVEVAHTVTVEHGVKTASGMVHGPYKVPQHLFRGQVAMTREKHVYMRGKTHCTEWREVTE